MTVICKAIDVIKDNKGTTIGYVLCDTNGNSMNVASDKIKAAILAKQVIVANLKVTSNNRLIHEDIKVSDKFNAVADRLSELSGVNHSKTSVKDFYFYTEFDNTPIFIIGTLDDSVIKFCVKDKDLQNELNAENFSRAATYIRRLYCHYVTKNKPVNNEIVTPKKEDSKNDYRVITLDTSKIYGNYTEIAKELGIEWISAERSFRVVDENTIVVVNLTCNRGISFIDSKVHGFKIVCNTDSRYEILLKYCEMQHLEVKDIDIKMSACIVYNTASIYNGTPVCSQLTYINNLKIDNSRAGCYGDNIKLDYIISNNVQVQSKKLTVESNCCAQYIHNMEADSKDYLNLIGDSWVVSNLKLTSENIRFNIDVYERNAEYRIQNSLSEIYGHYTYPNLYMIVCNYFLEANSVEANIKVKGNVQILKLLWKCKFEEPIEIEVKEYYSKLLIAEAIQNNLPDTLKIAEGGIAITNNTDITFKNLKIGVLYKSRAKKYTLYKTGIFLLDDQVKRFSITIENSLKPAAKNNVYDLELVIEELKEISKINPIKVYYGTQAYEILTTNGVEVEILNEDEIKQSVKNTSIKEQIIGITVLDTIEQSVSNGLKNCEDSNRYEINTGINVELPDEIIKTYNLSVAEGSNTTISTSIKALLDMIMIFPANNLPFTTEILNKISSNQKFRVCTEAVKYEENIRVHIINITYTGISDIDQYIVVTNGKNLIYMAYIGECQVVYNKGTSSYIQSAIQTVRKLDSIDLELKSIKQNLTMSSVNNNKQFMENISKLFNSTTSFIFNNKVSSILTTVAPEEVITFKVGCNKSKLTKFDKTYERNYLREIIRLEANDVKDSIIKDVETSYKNSVLLRTENIEVNTNSDIKNIASCKIASLWQLAQKYKINDSNNTEITLELLNDILELQYFNKITESYFKQALKRSKLSYHKYQTDGSFNIETYYFNGVMKKLHNEYMIGTRYIYVISFVDGDIEYYSADIDIKKVLSDMKLITSYNSTESFEDYIDKFNYIKKIYDLKYEAPDKMAYDLFVNGRELDSLDISICKLYEAINNAKNNVDSRTKLIKVLGVSDRFFDSITSTNSDIILDIVSKIPKSKQLLDMLGVSEEVFDNIVAYRKCGNAVKELRESAGKTLLMLYNSGTQLRRLSYKNYPTRVCIGMCKKTGYCYLFTINNKFTIPALRLPSFKDAMLLRKQLHEEESKIQQTDGLLQDLGWYQYEELTKTIELNLVNTKEVDEYPQKYRYLVAYISEKPEFEIVDGEDKIGHSDSEILTGYNYSYFSQYISMGAIHMVADIPSTYKYSKAYSINDSANKIIEYYNKNNNLYAFEIDSNTKAISEYSLKELFS